MQTIYGSVMADVKVGLGRCSECGLSYVYTFTNRPTVCEFCKASGTISEIKKESLTPDDMVTICNRITEEGLKK